jgi:septum formation topological specificity factor MinE
VKDITGRLEACDIRSLHAKLHLIEIYKRVKKLAIRNLSVFRVEILPAFVYYYNSDSEIVEITFVDVLLD